MSNQLNEGVKIAIENLIPSIELKHYSIEKTKLENKIKHKLYTSKHGYIEFGNTAIIYYLYSNGTYAVIEFTRSNIELTKSEKKILKLIPEIITKFDISSKTEFLAQLHRLSVRFSFENILVAKYIRKGLKNSKFWTPAMVISLLQDLSFKKYEGDKCTSGFIYSNEPDELLKKLPTEYIYYSFNNAIVFDETFFDSPASYRYIDGRNSYYLIDNFRRIRGIIRLSNPNKYNLIQRLNHQHLCGILNQTFGGRKWVSYIGNNGDITIALNNNQYFRWSNNHWHYRDTNTIKDYLTNKLSSIKFIDTIIRIIISLSELRMGSVILIAEDKSKLPKTIGKIDKSRIGEKLRNLFGSETIQSLEDLNGILLLQLFVS